jgi:hypothetical protein
MYLKIRALAFFICATGLAGPSASAAFFEIPNPGDSLPSGGSYTAGTTLLPVTSPEFSTITSLSDSSLTVDFSIPVEVLSVPDGWATWSAPPFSETDTPIVLYSGGPTQLTMTFSESLDAFGFELQPNPLGLFTFNATFFNGSDVVGAITRDVDGDGGARLFAGVSTAPTLPFTSVLINGSQDFAIAQLRYSLEDSVSVVPEPSTFFLTLFGLGCLGWLPRRSRTIKTG